LFQALLKTRDELALLVGDEQFFRAYNEIIYFSQRSYSPRSERFREQLFAWERDAVDKHFPEPPARVLVGGAGGGREAFALAEMGYRVVAFEPATELAVQMAEAARERGGEVEVYAGGYEALWSEGLAQGTPDGPTALPPAAELGRFDGILLGWGSFTHVYDQRDRQRLFEVCRDLLEPGGVLLASYFSAPEPQDGEQPSRSLRRAIRNALRRAGGHDTNDRFYSHGGFAHYFTTKEIISLSRYSDFEILDLHDHASGIYPHCVMRKRSETSAPWIPGR